MDRYILADIYETLGRKDRAISLYREILYNNPDDKRSEQCLRRLVANNTPNCDELNENVLEHFIKLNSKEKVIEFERWLIGN